MKKSILAVAIFLYSSALIAQNGESRSYLGLKAGVNLSNNKYDPEISGFSTSTKTGFAAGLYYNIGVSKLFSIQPEILYSQMGSKFSQTLTNPGYDGTTSIDYLSMPLLLKLTPGRRFAIFAGPQFDFMIGGKQYAENQPSVYLEDKINGFDLAGTAGAEFWLTRNIGVYGRYIKGFHDITEGTYLPNNEIKNNAWQFGLTLALRAKPKPIVVAPPPPPPPADRDNDGIADPNDKCPDVPGLAKYQGCPIPDSDKDGINDEQDKCPQVPGLAKYQGCPIPDTDKDGINDEEDKCPQVPGLARYQGCPIPDADGDGINDEEDKCPTIAGIPENGGCPAINFKSENIQFVSGSSTLTSGAKTELNKLVKILNQDYPDIKIAIEGHTDNTGKAEKNQVLSEKRAESVKTYLVSKKVAAERLSTSGFGADQPIADNATAAGKAKNRRVTFKVSQ
ncbi:MAG TPA: OmpA family protein [Chitinophagaceae bacterium]|nr:OmpA family protein [Chitinophagaceae bacterium]